MWDDQMETSKGYQKLFGRVSSNMDMPINELIIVWLPINRPISIDVFLKKIYSNLVRITYNIPIQFLYEIPIPVRFVCWKPRWV